MCNYSGCENPNYDTHDFCLFHMLDKNDEEGWLFWKLLNWNEERNESNFTEQDKFLPNFHNLRNKVVQLKDHYHFWLTHGQMNFKGFVFPQNPDNTFNPKNYPFIYKRYGAYIFDNATFEGGVVFDNYFFCGNVYFRNVIFKRTPVFGSAIFNGNCYFEKSIFLESTSFSSRLNPFEGTTFNGRELVFEDTRSTPSIYGANFSTKTEIKANNILFGSFRNVKNRHWTTEFNSQEFHEWRHDIGKTFYRQAKIQERITGNIGKANDYLYKERQYERRELFDGPIWNFQAL